MSSSAIQIQEWLTGYSLKFVRIALDEMLLQTAKQNYSLRSMADCCGLFLLFSLNVCVMR